MSQKSGFQKVLDAMTHQLPKAAKGKDYYPAVIVGANIGGLFSKHLAQATHGHKEQFITYKNSINAQDPMRSIYEQQRVAKTDFLMSSGLAVEASAASSDKVGVSKYLPQENAIVLETGEKINYSQLIIAQGLKEDASLIKGLDQAHKDFNVPVFTTQDHPSWNVFNFKFTKWLGNFNHGDAYFYIPKFPFRNEIGAYHFFNAQATWDWYKKIGKLSPTATFTIINANSRFTQFEDDVDQFFKEQCEKRGIRVIYNTELNEIDSSNMKITTTDANGKTQVRDFNNLYVIPPCSPHENLVEAGLVNAGGLKMDVNLQTLQNTKYENIWGIGDIANIPVTSSFWGGFHQAVVTSQNVYAALKGLPAEVAYDGWTKSIVHLGPSNLTWSIYDYNGPRSGHLLDKAGSIISRLRYLHWGKAKKKSFMKYYGGKATPLHTTVFGWKKKLGQLPKVQATQAEGTKYSPTH